MLVELQRRANPGVAASLRRAGATLVEHDLRVWALSPAIARRMLPALARRGLARRIEADRPVRALSSRAEQTVLPGSEWWLGAIRAAKLTPPGPGKPVTVVDTGLDVYHAEFAGRPDTTLLNPQTGTDLPDDFHGTAVSSLIAAPGVGMVGIYPQVVLREWDATPGGTPHAVRDHRGHRRGNAGRARRDQPQPRRPGRRPAAEGRGARRRPPGSLVVAAQGQDRFGGGPQTFPADDAHVLTVVSTERDGTRLRRHQRLGVERPCRARRESRGRRTDLGQCVGLSDGHGHELRDCPRLRRSSLDLDRTADARPESDFPAARPQCPAARSRLQLGQRLRRARRAGSAEPLRLRPGIPSSRTTTSTWCEPEAVSGRHAVTHEPGPETRRSSVAPLPRTRIRATCSASGSRPTEASA